MATRNTNHDGEVPLILQLQTSPRKDRGSQMAKKTLRIWQETQARHGNTASTVLQDDVEFVNRPGLTKRDWIEAQRVRSVWAPVLSHASGQLPRQLPKKQRR